MTNTCIIGKKVIYLPSCHSTNDFANQLIAAKGNCEGTVVVTSHQTKGRGQRGNSWESAPDQNLTFSVILCPGFLDASRQFQLNMAVSLAILEGLQELLPTGLSIKWPNDIFFKDKKLGGILIENSLIGKVLSTAVIGIGLNVNQNQFSHPGATSLAIATGQSFQLAALFEVLAASLENRYLALKNRKHQELEYQYLQHLYRYQEQHLFRRAADQEVFSGIILGVAPDGKLAIQTTNGIAYFGFKEVQFTW